MRAFIKLMSGVFIRATRCLIGARDGKRKPEIKEIVGGKTSLGQILPTKAVDFNNDIAISNWRTTRCMIAGRGEGLRIKLIAGARNYYISTRATCMAVIS